MTDETRSPVSSDLDSVLAVVCSNMSAAEQVAALGIARPSSSGRYTFRVQPTRFRTIEAIELRPWQQTEFGEVSIEPSRFSEWLPDTLTAVVGPLHEGPRLHARRPRLLGDFERPGLPAWAAVALEIDDVDGVSRVANVRIRTEPPEVVADA